ncbi:phage tail tape measure protein [Paenirhodobacter enshiensis]|uniref:Bacteriophage tail tape measure C-terminal domain-containing protein n=1 Tax=Paenirhodobacter enshiensis TaxID=1105367 RepID=A0A086XQP9_9RHOB|nr:phage tail tape measure protein [Paenirhodobacter enshiensis]KFI24349.1 hypothetical protein CG50_10630 [Paenirhodobacter enshiensis]
MAATARKEVGIRLVAKDGQVVKAELKGIGEVGAQAFSRLEAKATAMGKGVLGVAGEIARQFAAPLIAAGSLAGLGELVRGTAEYAQEVQKFAQISNTTPETFQKWAAGAQTVGIEQEKFADILKDVNDRIGDFVSTGGGPMKDFFDVIGPKVGVTIDDFKKLSGPDALQLYVSSLEKAGASQQDFAFYMEAMASDSTALVPLLRNNGTEMKTLGDRAASLGVVLGGAALESMRQTQTSLTELGWVAKGLGNQMAVAAAPAIRAFTNALVSAASEGGVLHEAISLLFGNIDRIATYAAVAATVFGGKWVVGMVAARLATISFVGSLALMRAALLRTGIGIAIVAAGEMVLMFTRLVEGAGSWGDALSALGDLAAGVWDGITSSAGAIPDYLASVWERAKSDFYDMEASILASWRNLLSGMGITEGAKAVDDAVTAALKASNDAYVRSGDLAASASSKASTSFDKARAAWGKLSDLVAKGSGDGVTRLGDLSASAEGLGTTLQDTGEKGKKAGQKMTDAEKAAKKAAQEAAKAAEEREKKIEQLGTEIAGDIVNPMKDALKSGEISFSSFTDTLSSMASNLASRLLDAAFQPIQDYLASLVSGSISSGGIANTLFGSLVANANGGVFFGGHKVSAFASGGVVSSPTLFPMATGTGLMGEAGPEAIMPLARGSDGRLGVQLNGGGGGDSVSGQPQVNVRNINVLDPALVGDYLATSAGERLIMNTIRRNKGSL